MIIRKISFTLLMGLSLFLTSCKKAEPPRSDKLMASIVGVNYTYEGIQEFYVAGEWGGNVSIGAGGNSFVCCVMLPEKWRPDLMVTVGWERSDCRNEISRERCPNDSSSTDPNGKPWQHKKLKKQVAIEPYESVGSLQVMFLPNDQIKVFVTDLGPRHPEHPAKLGPPRPIDPKDLNEHNQLIVEPPPLDSYAQVIRGINYTNEGIHSFSVDGIWRGHARVGADGDRWTCCVLIPPEWRPGLKVTVAWERSDCKRRGIAAEKCTAVADDPSADKPSKWPRRRFEKQVEIEPYGEETAVQVFFLPNDEIKVYVSKYRPSDPSHPAKLGKPRPLSPDEWNELKAAK